MTRKFASLLTTSSGFGLALLATVAVGPRSAEAQTAGVHILADSGDVFVTVTDLNARKKLLTEEKIVKGSRKTVEVLRDSNGKGRICWTAEQEPSDRSKKSKFGKATQDGLDAGTEVKIRATSDTRSSC